jgi:hypothetical protein
MLKYFKNTPSYAVLESNTKCTCRSSYKCNFNFEKKILQIKIIPGSILSRALLGNATTINVDSPDLTRKFIGTIAEITHNKYNTLFCV